MIIFAAALFSGIAGGMGLGGGAVLIPVLTLFLNMPQKQAQVINLIYFVPTAVIALTDHIKNKRIEKNILPPMTAAGVMGCIIGAFAAMLLSGGILRRMFGLFMSIMGIRELVIGIRPEQEPAQNRQ
ncbi:MAG: sulfite exporter TauE/SafE family protein [Firmicutes bacterium]|nr:sulfite exporter TauE/SafE family protein [Bacillota bacterium]